MPRSHKRNLSAELKERALKALFAELKAISSEEGAKRFMLLFTKGEIDSILRRIIVKEFLASGKKYRDIKESLEISGNTISRIKRMTKGGAEEIQEKTPPSWKPKTKKHRKILNYKGFKFRIPLVPK